MLTIIILAIGTVLFLLCIGFICGVAWARNQQLKEQEHYNKVVEPKYFKHSPNTI